MTASFARASDRYPGPLLNHSPAVAGSAVAFPTLMLTLRSAAGSWMKATWLVFVPRKSPLATKPVPIAATDRARTGCGGFGVADAAAVGSTVGDALDTACGNVGEQATSTAARTTSGRMLTLTGGHERTARAS